MIFGACLRNIYVFFLLFLIDNRNFNLIALSLAGCSELHPKIPADAGIIVCINQKYKNVTDIGLFLNKHGVDSPF